MITLDSKFSKTIGVSAALTLVSGALLITMIWPTLEAIGSRWLKMDESYSHGFLIFAVSIVLVSRTWWQNRPSVGFYPLWLIPLAGALGAFVFGELIRLQALRELVVVPLLLGWLAVFLGWRQVRHFIIPIGILFFAVPVWDYLSWTLQLITVAVNQFLLGFMDIEFEVEGVFVYLIGIGTFEVAHGCSGLRYLLVGQSLSVLYGELNFRKLKTRLFFFLVAVGLALLANWIRVFVIIYMGYETNMESRLIEDHDSFGWWVFAATLIPLYFFGSRLERGEVNSALLRKRMTTKPASDSAFRSAWFGAGVTSALVLFSMLGVPGSSGSLRSAPESIEFSLLNDRYGILFEKQLMGWQPQIRNPDRQVTQTFFDKSAVEIGENVGERFYVGVFSYDFQRHRAELIQYNNRIYDSEQWMPEEFFTLRSPVSGNLRGITLRRFATGERIHLAFGYHVAGRWETDQWRAKLAQAASLVSSRADATLYVFGLSCSSCEEPQAVLGEFIGEVMPPIFSLLESRYQPQTHQ